MFLRIDKLQVELPEPKEAGPNSAAEMTRNSAARKLCGYLFLRGGVHALAYAKALEGLTGVDMRRMLPIPKIENARFPEARRYQAQGSHRKLYRFSPDDYKDIAAVWQGPSPDGSGNLEVVDGPPQNGKLADLISEAFAPEYHAEEIYEIAKKIYSRAGVE